MHCVYCADMAAARTQHLVEEAERVAQRSATRDGGGQRNETVQTAAGGLSDAIQNLIPELREIILKEYIVIKRRERKSMGWDELHYEIDEAPFCEKRSRIVKVMFCSKCNSCGLKGLCYECYKNGEKHYLGYPVYDENDYAEIFQKFY